MVSELPRRSRSSRCPTCHCWFVRSILKLQDGRLLVLLPRTTDDRPAVALIWRHRTLYWVWSYRCCIWRSISQLHCVGPVPSLLWTPSWWYPYSIHLKGRRPTFEYRGSIGVGFWSRITCGLSSKLVPPQSASRPWLMLWNSRSLSSLECEVHRSYGNRSYLLCSS